MSTDDEWEKWGQKDPYFAVLTAEKFRRSRLTDEARAEFFDSGRKYLHNILKVCKEKIDKDFSPETALDFGCGTGRVLIPLARSIPHVVGRQQDCVLRVGPAASCTVQIRDDECTSRPFWLHREHSFPVCTELARWVRPTGQRQTGTAKDGRYSRSACTFGRVPRASGNTFGSHGTCGRRSLHPIPMGAPGPGHSRRNGHGRCLDACR